MNKKELGISKLEYFEDGSFARGLFIPTLSAEFSNTNLFCDLPVATEEEKVKQDAHNVLSNWIERVNEIQLIDLTKFKITSEVEEGGCTKHSNGNVKNVELRSYLEERS